MNVESQVDTEILPSTQAASPESEVVSKLLKKQDNKIKEWVANYFSRLPKSRLLSPREYQGFYKEADDADRRLENDLERQIWKILEDKKLTAEKAMLIRGICAGTIRELNHGISKVHPNSLPFVGQLTRHIIILGTEISNKHFRDQQGNPQIVDRDWLREFAMDLWGLKYTSRLGELETKLKQFVENPPTQPAD